MFCSVLYCTVVLLASESKTRSRCPPVPPQGRFGGPRAGLMPSRAPVQGSGDQLVQCTDHLICSGFSLLKQMRQNDSFGITNAYIHYANATRHRLDCVARHSHLSLHHGFPPKAAAAAAAKEKRCL